MSREGRWSNMQQQTPARRCQISYQSPHDRIPRKKGRLRASRLAKFVANAQRYREPMGHTKAPHRATRTDGRGRTEAHCERRVGGYRRQHHQQPNPLVPQAPERPRERNAPVSIGMVTQNKYSVLLYRLYWFTFRLGSSGDSSNPKKSGPKNFFLRKSETKTCSLCLHSTIGESKFCEESP
jgi:hypothetical protein